ncbi:hypothetical protein [Roseibium album]|uniref:hypothetical protein n=1 Tax=Roseibium album TaxID=311410 RepID=UPI003BB10B5F
MTESPFKPCPFCGDAAFIRTSYDEDECYWAWVECKGCGARTRGHWASDSSNTCPIFYAEVRDDWNQRSPTHLMNKESF